MSEVSVPRRRRTLSRWIRFYYPKKRGDRHTISSRTASVGEAVFFAAMLLAGSLCLTATITSLAIGFPWQGGAFFYLGLSFLAAVSLTFMGIGLWGAWRLLLSLNVSAERRSSFGVRARQELLLKKQRLEDDYPSVPREEFISDSPGTRLAYRLPTLSPESWKLWISAGFCVVWDATAVILTMVTLQLWSLGQFAPLITCVSIAFLMIGGVASYLFVRALARHVAIEPTICEVDAAPMLPGTECDACLIQPGHVAFKRIVARLVCEEEAIYRQGTDLRQERRAVHDETLLEAFDVEATPGRPLSLLFKLRTPASAMHSFQANHNAVRWRLIVDAEPKAWPAFRRSYPVLVHPLPPQRKREPQRLAASESQSTHQPLRGRYVAAFHQRS